MPATDRDGSINTRGASFDAGTQWQNAKAAAITIKAALH